MDKALETMISNMPEKTGKSLEEWKGILQQKKFAKHGEAMAFLKAEHGVTHGFANTIVALCKEPNEEEDLLSNQYKGKESLIPIREKIVALALLLGQEVKLAPKKSSLSIIRKKQFALIKPATKTRIDLGLKLVGKDFGDRLQNSGPFGTMCTHRVQINHIDEVDAELAAWLREAYEKAN